MQFPICEVKIRVIHDLWFNATLLILNPLNDADFMEQTYRIYAICGGGVLLELIVLK